MIHYYPVNQLSFEGFETPFETNMDPNNRWVRLSALLPWEEFAQVYYQDMALNQGAPSKDPRLVIGALIIKHKLKLDDRGTIEMIQENPYITPRLVFPFAAPVSFFCQSWVLSP